MVANPRNLNLEDEVTRLEAELRIYRELKLSSIERRLNELLDALDDPATPQTKGQRLRERLGIIATTVSLVAIAQSKFDIPLVFQQPPKQEQVAPKLSPPLVPSLVKPQVKPQLRTAPPVDKPAAKPVNLQPSTFSLQPSSTKAKVSLEKLMKAIATQESGGNHQLINSDSGATGKWQVMPINIPEWSRASLGREVSHAEFLASPQLQREIVKHRLGLYLEKQSVPGRCQEEVIRRVASAWYSGRPSLWNNERPQFSNGRRYPSIASYTKSVWNLYQQVKPSVLDKTRQRINAWALEFQKDPAAGDIIAGYTVSSARGMRVSPTTGEYKMHQGIDLAVPIGTPLIAPVDGQIECDWWSDAGKVALFTSDEFPGLRFDLLHLSKCTGKQGAKLQVNKGEVIGFSGTAGTGPHLHLAIKSQESGKFLRVRSGWLYWFVTGKEPK